jgi:hypothetical protein
MTENIYVHPEVIDDIYSRLGINKPKETFQQIVEQNLIKEGYKMGYAEGTHKNRTLPDTIEIDGIKYKRVENPEPKILKELFEIYVEYGNWTQSKDVIAQELVNIVKEIIPDPIEYKAMGIGNQSWIDGYNQYRKILIDTIGGNKDD